MKVGEEEEGPGRNHRLTNDRLELDEGRAGPRAAGSAEMPSEPAQHP